LGAVGSAVSHAELDLVLSLGLRVVGHHASNDAEEVMTFFCLAKQAGELRYLGQLGTLTAMLDL
jgi:hypothetical protein